MEPVVPSGPLAPTPHLATMPFHPRGTILGGRHHLGECRCRAVLPCDTSRVMFSLLLDLWYLGREIVVGVGQLNASHPPWVVLVHHHQGVLVEKLPLHKLHWCGLLKHHTTVRVGVRYCLVSSPPIVVGD
jgi:hypothetical protein